jgi:hypothetical protein
MCGRGAGALQSWGRYIKYPRAGPDISFLLFAQDLMNVRSREVLLSFEFASLSIIYMVFYRIQIITIQPGTSNTKQLNKQHKATQQAYPALPRLQVCQATPDIYHHLPTTTT